jgi:hypothetical protein
MLCFYDHYCIATDTRLQSLERLECLSTGIAKATRNAQFVWNFQH